MRLARDKRYSLFVLSGLSQNIDTCITRLAIAEERIGRGDTGGPVLARAGSARRQNNPTTIPGRQDGPDVTPATCSREAAHWPDPGAPVPGLAEALDASAGSEAHGHRAAASVADVALQKKHISSRRLVSV
jgi:hypothetical protein